MQSPTFDSPRSEDATHRGSDDAAARWGRALWTTLAVLTPLLGLACANALSAMSFPELSGPMDLVMLPLTSVIAVGWVAVDGGSWPGNRVVVCAAAAMAATYFSLTTTPLYFSQSLGVLTFLFAGLGLAALPGVGAAVHAARDLAPRDAHRTLAFAVLRAWTSLAIALLCFYFAQAQGSVVLCALVLALVALVHFGTGREHRLLTLLDIGLGSCVLGGLGVLAS